LSNDEELVFVFMPSLVANLISKEREKGFPLTESEVIAIRDGAHVVASPMDVAEKVTEQRGYDDIDPENVWTEWQEFRKTL
jgi:hypothetical protein